ncbi:MULTISPECIES: alpha-2,8-polysialyltransferase family protein [Shewanella]|uniref:alpha-2,8-polysialyltransferase family protein n=1 Tax=Shewanella TaxID=22 RepID=UPI001F44FFE2|nr:alpha-2,8-polysialyltransferase family protein [Shewanella indica]
MIVGFFELRLMAHTRFPRWLTEEFNKHDSEVRVVLFYEQDDVEDKESILNSYPAGTELVKVGNIGAAEITSLINFYKLDRLVVMAQRIPDMCFVSAAKSVGVPTIMYQHGLYIPFMKREKGLFIKNFNKALRFLKYAIVTAQILNVSWVRMLGGYLKVYLYGVKPVDSGLPNEKFNVDKVLVYGQHWKKYHTEQFGYSIEQQIIVGAPDFNDLKVLLNQNDHRDGVCYIAQTLVEDGRLPRQQMVEFIANLATCIERLNIKLFVRLHPRSDISLYEPLKGVAELSKSEFPKFKVYIGHYSSMIAKATFFSDKIILVDFPGHEIPDYIDMLRYSRVGYSQVSSLVDSVGKAISEGVSVNKVNNNIKNQDEFFDSNVEEPFQAAALQVLS